MALDVRIEPRRRRTAGWLAAGLLGLFALLWLLVAVSRSPLVDLDHAVVGSAHEALRGHPRLLGTLEVVSVVSSPSVVRPLLVLGIGFALLRRRFDVAGWLAVSAALELVLAAGAKQLQQRPRPQWSDPFMVLDTYSFPSGHAAGAGLVVASAVMMTHGSVARRPARWTLDALWILVGLVIGLDRVLLGVHYPSDVLAGWALGAALPLAVAALVPWATVATGPAPTTTGIRPSRLAVVLNPVKVSNPAGFRRLVRSAAQRHGWDVPLWYETTPDDAGTTMTHQALADGADVVVAAGGDGTVRVVSAELARTGVPLAIVPLGSGNLLARNLALPLRATDAVEVALSGQDRAIDVVRVSGDALAESCFMVMGGLGFDAEIMAGASDALKARMGWRAYVVSAVRNLHYPAHRIEVIVDDGPPQRFRARTVVVGNVGLLQAGIPLLPDARIDDGLLDVVVIAPKRLIGWVWVVVRVLRRGRHTDAQLARMTGARVVVRSGQPLARQLDGDPVGEGREIRARVLPGTLLVRVPR